MPKEEEKKEEESELEEQIVREIEEDSVHEISNDFTQETGDVVIEDNKLKDFITQSFSSSNFSPSLERINAPQQIIEQDFEQITEDGKLPQVSYDAGARKEEKRLYESRSRSMELTNLSPNKRMAQKVEFIDPLAGMNIQSQNSMEPKMIQTKSVQMKQRLPFERDKDDKYKEVKL